ncbi:SufD family Fe-S cluster assembly protein [uncultured Phascolarctobacterium sp.]|uniref:SufB/SufD family protein n=1 Tax=uncultured Phascolarctobacterium sp. TaxID=512296 RepID=UPI00261088D1|nr:SufD family Fe-S cluster assembly protein [uncultured Phascolarctobacterium sp.]
MDKINLIVNKLPAPTWNRLCMNESSLELSASLDKCEPKVALQGSVCLNKKQLPRIPGKNCCGCVQADVCPVHGIDFASLPTGMGEDMERLGEGQRIHLVADAGKSTAAVTLRYADGQQCYNTLEIEAKPNSDLIVYMTYISTASAKGMAAVQTKIAAAQNAKVKLVQVQLLGRGFLHLNDVGCNLAGDARFEVLQLQLGGAQIYNGVRTELIGDNSSFDAAIAYYGRQAQRLDMNFIANHYGKNTACNMTADGVLQEGACKIYRGTIDFKNGSAGAIGDEKETVLLLSDDVVNQSIPLILCSEEDVQGNHGASIGRLDEELLFYLMSRGFSETDAVAMMAKAKIEGICRRIDDEETVQLVERYLEGVIADAE